MAPQKRKIWVFLERRIVELLDQLARAGHRSRSKLVEELLNDALHHHAAGMKGSVDPMVMNVITNGLSQAGDVRAMFSRLPTAEVDRRHASFRQHLEAVHPQLRNRRGRARRRGA